MPFTGEKRMAQLDVALLVGKESKEWLANVTALVERLERAATKLKGSAVDASDDDEGTTDDENDDFAPVTKKKATVKVNGFDDEDDTELEATSDDDEDEGPVTKKKTRKITVDDVNDACKARAAETGGKEGRQEVLTILKKKFKTTSVTELKPEQYAAVIAAMKG